MASQKDLQVMLLEEIGKRIKDLAFRANLSRQGFYKKMPFGKHSFHISFIRHITDIDVTADVAIRFDALEDLIHKYIQRPFLSEKEKRATFSLGTELGRLRDTGQKRWTIYNKSDIDEVTSKIVEEFLEIGIPYLEKYSDINVVFKAISSVSREANLLNAFPVKQAINAVGLAHLLNQDNEFHKIADEMTSYLTPIPNSGLEIFQEFKEKLLQI